jgi:putative ABC transport system permease protein
MTDLRLALRLCLRHPLLSIAAIGSLALGIGANTAIFTVLNGSVLKPLPYDQPSRLVAVWETNAATPQRPVAPANFLDWRREVTAFSALAAFDDFTATLTGTGEAQRIHAVSASGNFFEVLGVQAQIGRVFTSDDDRAGAPRVAVLTDGLWHQQYGGAADALGKTVILNDIAHTIVGVLPRSFDMQMVAGGEIWMTGDRSIPRSFPYPGDITAVRDSHLLAVIGRLKDGATREQAQAQLSATMASLSERYPQSNAGLGANVVPLHEQIVGTVRPLIVLLQIAVAVLLLIACANVAHLLLGQAATRRAEISMRYALGADRSRIIRQLLIETLIIAVPGGIVGLAFAIGGVKALTFAAPRNLPRLSEVAIDPSVLAFTLGMTLLTAIVFGLGPALQTARTSVNDLGRIGQRVAGGRGVRRGHQLLVVGELALAQALLVGAGLLLASFAHATNIELGFATQDRVLAELNLVPSYVRTINEHGAIDPTRKIRFINAVLDRVGSGQGIRAVAASSTAPLTGAPNRGMRIEGDAPLPPEQQPTADFQLITADYFRALGITLVAGRTFNAGDRADTPPVLIVNQALVDKYLAGRDPVGKVILFGGNKRHQIVGVVANTRYRNVEQPADPTFYLPLEQNDERWPFLAFTVWTDHNDAALANATTLLRSAVREADPAQPISRLRTIEEMLSASLAERRFNTWIVGLFAATALLLAGIGTYGVMAFAVTSRTRELGVRSALGASPRDLIVMVLRQGLLLTIVASAIGLIAAVALTRFMASMLFNVAPRDPITFALVAGVLALVALAATLIPARRAMTVNPTEVLRS